MYCALCPDRRWGCKDKHRPVPWRRRRLRVWQPPGSLAGPAQPGAVGRGLRAEWVLPGPPQLLRACAGLHAQSCWAKKLTQAREDMEGTRELLASSGTGISAGAVADAPLDLEGEAGPSALWAVPGQGCRGPGGLAVDLLSGLRVCVCSLVPEVEMLAPPRATVTGCGCCCDGPLPRPRGIPGGGAGLAWAGQTPRALCGSLFLASAWVQVPNPPCPGCVVSGKSLNISEPLLGSL